VAGHADGQVLGHDHLMCYSVKDSQKVEATVDL